MPQPRRRGLPLGHVGLRHAVVGVLFPDRVVVADALGDEQSVVTRVGHQVVPGGAHFGGGLDVVPVAVELEAVGVVQGLAGLDAQHGLVRLRLIAGDVVAVVGHHRRQAELPPDLQQLGAHAGLDVEPVVHELEEVVVLAVDVLPHAGRRQRLVELPQAQARLHVARRTTGGGDDALGALGDDLGVHARVLAQLPLVRRHRRQVEEVVQPLHVFGEHRLVQVRAAAGDVVALLVRFAPRDAVLVEAALRRHVRLDTDDGLDALLLHLPVKRVGPEHVAVVGDADRRHALPRDLVGEQVDLRHAVQHRVLGVIVEMHEAGVGHGSGL